MSSLEQFAHLMPSIDVTPTNETATPTTPKPSNSTPQNENTPAAPVGHADTPTTPDQPTKVQPRQDQPTQDQPTPTKPNAINHGIQKTYHTKTKKDFWLVTVAEFLPKQAYLALLASCVQSGGWRSKPYQNSPGGFGFDSEQTAEQWAAKHLGRQPDTQTPKIADELADELADDLGDVDELLRLSNQALKQPSPYAQASEKMGEKFADFSRRLSEQAKKRKPERNQRSTARRESFWVQMERETRHLQRAANAAGVLADAWLGGSVPHVLADIKTMKAIKELTKNKSKYNSMSGDYYESDEPADPQNPKVLALLKLIKENQTDEDREQLEKEKQQSQLNSEVAKLRDVKFAGFFPSPPKVVKAVINAAGDLSGKDVLEPSAGLGDIADAAKNAGAARVQCVEYMFQANRVLKHKKHTTERADFLEWAANKGKNERFDVVLMNPPYEKNQALEHVRAAFSKLKPGGRLVAVMPPSWQHNQANLYKQFREFVADYGGQWQPLPDGSFNGPDAFRPTGISCGILTLDAPDGTPDGTPGAIIEKTVDRIIQDVLTDTTNPTDATKSDDTPTPQEQPQQQPQENTAPKPRIKTTRDQIDVLNRLLQLGVKVRHDRGLSNKHLPAVDSRHGIRANRLAKLWRVVVDQYGQKWAEKYRAATPWFWAAELARHKDPQNPWPMVRLAKKAYIKPHNSPAYYVGTYYGSNAVKVELGCDCVFNSDGFSYSAPDKEAAPMKRFSDEKSLDAACKYLDKNFWPKAEAASKAAQQWLDETNHHIESRKKLAIQLSHFFQKPRFLEGGDIGRKFNADNARVQVYKNTVFFELNFNDDTEAKTYAAAPLLVTAVSHALAILKQPKNASAEVKQTFIDCAEDLMGLINSTT